MAHTTFTLLANNGYSVQDNPEPEAWMGPILKAGLRHLEYFADHMDPLYFENVVRERSQFFRATLRALQAHDVRVVCVTTGRLFYLTNGLSHPFADARRGALRYCERLADLAAALGAQFIGGHFDYISQTDAARGAEPATRRLVRGLLRLAEFCARRRLQGIFLEQMYTPQLRPYTIAEAQRMLRWLNRRSAVPFYLQMDTGHMALVPRDDKDHGDSDKDPYRWLSTRYPGGDKVWVHAQQTDRNHTRHWPFTAPYNRRGIISPERVLRSIEASRVREAYVSFEILYPRGTPIDRIGDDLRLSARRFRRAFAALGYTETDGRFEKG